MRKYIDLTGKKFGNLLVTGIHSRDRNNHIRWGCLCDCGSDYDVLGTHLRRGNITHCGCNRPRGNKYKNWRGCGELSGNYWDNVKRSANGNKGRRNPVELSITIRYAWMLFLRQNKKCALSGISMKMAEVTTNMKSQTASIDRIDSGKGYIEGNVQWVHKDINKMKNTFNQEYFINMCERVGGMKNE